MATVKNNNSITIFITGILLIAVLLTAVCPIAAYAADDNPDSFTLDVFPAVGVSSDTMNVNLGTINTLYGGGIVNVNRGHISSSRGTVKENYGSIENLSAGHVGTNYGTITRIDNTGSLGVNDKDGTVLFIGTGNEVLRNDGTIQDNVGNVSDNYGTVCNNYGNVIMHDGQIVNNCQGGTVTFEAKISGSAAIPAKGTIVNNESRVIISSGTVTVKENTGNIEINNAAVTVETNSGKITVGNNATLICGVNEDSGVIRKDSESAFITCSSNDGHVYDETAVRYEIVFAGDDGKAVILEWDFEKDGVYYTHFGGGVIFTLPPEYECSSAMKLKSGDVNIWGLSAFPAEEDTEFTVVCHKCSSCESLGHNFNAYISNGDATCTADGTKTAVCANGCGTTDTIADTGSAKGHVYGEWITIKEATETETGARERTCSVCSDKDMDVIPVLTHSHIGILQNGTSSTCTAAGVKGYYTCSCGKSFEDVACNTEIVDLDAWKAEGGKGYIPPAGHSFNAYISNKDAACTADGTKTAICSRGCGATDTVKDPGTAKGHRYGEWVTVREATETETGIRERTCSVCGVKDKDVIPVLTHTHKVTLRNGTSSTCTAAGVKDCYTCSCGKSFEDAACNTEIADLNAWKAEGGKGYIPPAGHSFNTYTCNNDAACTADGTKTAVCARGCGAVDTIADTGSAKGHAYGGWVTAKEATETETGIRERTCSVCGARDKDVIPVLIHTHKVILQNGIPSACTAAGVKGYYTCSCGKSFEDAACSTGIADLDVWKTEGGSGYIAPTGHTFGEWVTVKEPTLSETGSGVRICSVCAAEETKQIPVLAPAAYSIIAGADSEWTKGSTDGLVFSSDAPFDKFDSVRIDGTVIGAENYFAESGSTRITISPAYLETLDTGEHSVEIVSTDGTTTANFAVLAARPAEQANPAGPASPQSGDSSRVFPWTVLLIGCCGALAGIAIVVKKRKN